MHYNTRGLKLRGLGYSVYKLKMRTVLKYLGQGILYVLFRRRKLVQIPDPLNIVRRFVFVLLGGFVSFPGMKRPRLDTRCMCRMHSTVF